MQTIPQAINTESQVLAWKQQCTETLFAKGYKPTFLPASHSVHNKGNFKFKDVPALTCNYQTPIGECYLSSICLETGNVFRFA